MFEAIFLGLSMFVAATMTGIFGVGGGLLLIVLMAQVVPLTVLIPLHALAMLISNTGRAWIQRKYVRWDYVPGFLLGTLVGVAAISPLVVYLPKQGGQILLGVFVIAMTWRPQWFRLSAWVSWFSGALTGALTMVFGATGPLVMSVLPKSDWNRQQIVGTHGAVMTFQHGFKFVAFWFLGFEPLDWSLAIALIVLGAIAGNLLGARLLGQFPEHRFKSALDWLLTLLALRMIWQGLV